MADSQTATSAPEFKSAHFIGIGGAGMSVLAQLLTERGATVTGKFCPECGKPCGQ